MNRYYIFYVFMVVIVLILATVLIWLIWENGVFINDESESRFVEVYSKKNYTVLVDTSTNVCYLKTGNAITVLIDKDGNPIIWEEETQE